MLDIHGSLETIDYMKCQGGIQCNHLLVDLLNLP